MYFHVGTAGRPTVFDFGTANGAGFLPGMVAHQVVRLAHERGGITKAASALISPPAAPRDSRTLATPRSKQPTEDPAAISTGIA